MVAPGARPHVPTSSLRAVLAGIVALALLAAVTVSTASTPAAADGNEAPNAPFAARAITGGSEHTCAILPSGRVKCWGQNLDGQLGQDSNGDVGDQPGELAALPAVNLGVGRTATAISAGIQHTCALLDDGTVKCWGNGGAGRLGQGNTATLGDQPGEMAALAPVDLGPGRTATAITAGGAHTCAVLDDGSVKCWGSNASGRLGQDNTENVGDQAGELAALAPVDLGPGRTATAVSASFAHTCALLDDGTVKCWGSGNSGQLGNDATGNVGDQAGDMAALAPVNLGVGRTATAVSAGPQHSCALLDDGTVKCWGSGADGRLGQGSTTTLGDQPGEMAALAPVTLGADAVGVSAGSGHTCALLVGGSVKCWGAGRMLGQDTIANIGDQAGEMAALVPVNLGGSAAGLATGYFHSCVRFGDASVKCWGNGGDGRLGQGNTTDLGDGAGEMAALGVVDLGFVTELAVVKSADETAVATGGTIHYHVTVVNAGDTTLTGLTVDDPNATDCEQAVPDLAGGAQHTIDCTHVTTPADEGTYSNVATADSAQTAPVASNQVDVTVAPPTGVTGSVSAAGSGPPVAGAFVTLLRSADFSIAAAGVADGGGGFSLSAAPGSYFVYLVDPSGAHAAGFAGAPTLIDLDPGEIAPVDAEMAPLRGSVAGTVTEAGSGDPIPGAWALSLRTTGDTGALEEIALADGAGGYSLDGLSAGTHFIGFVDPAGGHESRFAPDSPNVPASTPVAVSAGGVSPVSASLPVKAVVPGGQTISGTATEAGSGTPLAGVHVVALSAADFSMARGGVTDGAGHYSLDLAAGGYLLAFVDSTATHRMEWFDGRPSTGLGDADVVVAPGVADVALERSVGAIAGTITDDPGGTPLAGAWVIAIGPTGIAGGTVTAGNGSYEIGDLAPGNYVVTFADPSGVRAQEFFDGGATYGDADPVAVTAGATATVDAALAAAP